MVTRERDKDFMGVNLRSHVATVPCPLCFLDVHPDFLRNHIKRCGPGVCEWCNKEVERQMEHRFVCESRPTCAHHWVCGAPTNLKVQMRCKRCGAEKTVASEVEYGVW